MKGEVARFASTKVGTTEIKNTFRKIKEVSFRKKVVLACIFVIPKQKAIRADKCLCNALESSVRIGYVAYDRTDKDKQ